MSAMLTAEQRVTLKKAAYGAITLLSLSGFGGRAAKKEFSAGTVTLVGANGLVGAILSGGSEKFTITGNSADAIADEVLDGLSSTIAVLSDQDPNEAANFRNTVTIALSQAAAASGGPTPGQSAVIDKMRTALGETI